MLVGGPVTGLLGYLGYKALARGHYFTAACYVVGLGVYWVALPASVAFLSAHSLGLYR